MNRTCKRCNWQPVELNLTEEQRREIWRLENQGFKLQSIKLIREYTGVELRDAKGAFLHLNGEYGKCVRCDYEKLSGENVDCPSCGAFNYNWRNHNVI